MSPFPTVHHNTMYVRNHDMGARDIILGVGDDGVGSHDVTLDVGNNGLGIRNGYVCVYRKLSLGVNGQS